MVGKLVKKLLSKHCSYLTTFAVLPPIIDQGYDKIRQYTNNKCVVYQQQFC